MYSVTKRLVESEELQQIDRLDHDVLGYVYGVCLPFDKGTHILPLEAVEQVDGYLRAQRAKRSERRGRFLHQLGVVLDEARDELLALGPLGAQVAVHLLDRFERQDVSALVERKADAET